MSPLLLLANQAAAKIASEKLAVDSSKTTVLGNAFVAPKDWMIRVKGDATILEAPEGDSWVALVDPRPTRGSKRTARVISASWLPSASY